MATLPPPTLASTTAPMAKPLIITLADVKLADGSVAAEADVTSAGILLFRGSPGAGDLWDEAQKGWRAAPGDDELKAAKPVIAVFKQGASPSWQATLVAIGQKDAGDAKVYKAAENGTPSYFARGLVKTGRGEAEETTLGPASAAFTFVDDNANSRFTAQFDSPSTKPDQASKVRMQLKGSGLQPAGYLEIRTQPNFEVEIANCDASGNVLAKVLLVASGEIRLAPAAGARVVIDGDVEANRVMYAPSGGGATQWLA
jgi:hypothetical protein